MNRLPLHLSVVLFLSSAAVAQPPGKPNPQAPTLNAVSTFGGQRGQSIDLTLTGTNLADPTGVWTSFPAKVTIPTDANNGKNATSLRVKLDVPADAPLGFHSLRVATKRGMSNSRLFCIDDLPQVMQTSSNRDPKMAQALTTPCVVVGRVEAEQTDYYKVAVKANQRVSFEVIGRRLGGQLDPQLTLLDAATGKELPAGFSNDAPGLQTDARLSYVFKTAGDVLVALRDVSYRGGADFSYRLRVGEFPCATTPLPLAAKRGTKAQVRFAGPAVDGVAPVDVQAPTDPLVETVQVAPRGANGQHGWPVVLHLSDLDEATEKEPNNDLKMANRLAVPGAMTARFEQKDDLDHFVFVAKKGQRLAVEAHTVEHLSPTEVYLVIKDAKGAQLAASNPNAGAKLDFTAPADGDYYLVAEHLHSWGGPEEVYRVTVTPYQPDFALTLTMDRWDMDAGGKVSIPVFATRTGFDAPIEVSVVGVKGLSGTVTIPAGPPKPNQPSATLVVTADELPSGPLSFAVQGKATIDGRPVVRHASVRALVSTSLGNLAVVPQPMTTQLAMAVRERPPFTLALKLDAPEAQPGKPIAAMVQINVVPSYQDEVALSIEGLPPDAKQELASVKTQPGQTTVKLRLLLPATAKLGPNQLVVVGTGKHLGRDWAMRSAPVGLVVKK